jgi:hypothetical protein
VVAISCCLCSRTVHALLRQGEGQKGRKRLGQQPSHVTSGSTRYTIVIGDNEVRYLFDPECRMDVAHVDVSLVSA